MKTLALPCVRGIVLAPLLVATAVAAAPVHVTVEVVEYYTQKPIVGAKVTLRETSGAKEVTAVTGEKGKARFDVPHLDFQFVEATREGYLTRAELEPWRVFVRQASLDKRHKQGDDELAFEAWLVPTSWVEANIKVRTREQALAITNDWARDCAKDGPTSLERKGEVWIADYPCMQVRVNIAEGTPYVITPNVPTSAALYDPAQALADALSSPLVHVGTRVWPGHFSIPSCVYRNEAVFVVSDYCTIKEISSTGFKILHPTKGLVTLYAEAKTPISTTAREDYQQWKFRSNDPFPGLRLAMTLDELLAWETRRGKLVKGECDARLRSSTDKNAGCHLKTSEVEQWWDGLYRPLLKDPPADWYTLIKLVRARARKDGRPDPRMER